MDVEWARSIRDEAAEFDVAFFMKQMSSRSLVNAKRTIPEDLKIRHYPDDKNAAWKEPLPRLPALVGATRILKTAKAMGLTQIVEVAPAKPLGFQKLSQRIVHDLCSIQHVIAEKVPGAAKKAQEAIDWIAGEMEDLGLLLELVHGSIRLDCQRKNIDYDEFEAAYRNGFDSAMAGANKYVSGSQNEKPDLRRSGFFFPHNSRCGNRNSIFLHAL